MVNLPSFQNPNLRKGGLVLLFLVFGSILVLGLLWWQGYIGDVWVWPEKDTYSRDEMVRVKIWNLTSRRVCFSSCYPFYFWRNKNGNAWERLEYEECPFENRAVKCLAPLQVKAFEIDNLHYLDPGKYSLNFTTCEGCREGESFSLQDANYFYSQILEIR